MINSFPLQLPHRPESKISDFLLAAVFSCIHFILTSIVNKVVPEPYMDEIFHVGQTRSYCKGNYTWNPLITTPPALYVISMPFCGSERYVNSILMFFAVPAFCRFRRMFSRDEVLGTASVVATLPILVMSSVLFYTDLLSLTTVIWGFSIGNPQISVIFFTLATLCRQTNIVWAASYAALRILLRFNPNHKLMSMFSSLYILWPFEILALAFITFFYQNDFQVVLGDAKAHQPKFHMAQFWYMLAFCAGHSFLQFTLYVPKIIKKISNLKSIIFLFIISFTIYHYSYDHAYLLSDNRHYTFYIWKRFLSKPNLRVAISPMYLFSAIFMCSTVSKLPHAFKLIYIAGCLLVLVPAHLFEMRYYIVPYTMWRLASTFKSPYPNTSYLECFFHVLVTSIVFFVFLNYPFTWAHQPGELQRFMF